MAKRKKEVVQKRFLDGGIFDRYNSDWQGVYNVNFETQATNKYVRFRARDMWLNDPWTQAIVRLIRDEVIGEHGFKLACQYEFPTRKAGINNGKVIEEEWEDFNSFGNITIREDLSGAMLQRHIAETWVVDGEVFIRTFRGREEGKHGVRYQILTADYIDENYYTSTPNGAIYQGIEYDTRGKVLAYHCYTRNPYDPNTPFLGENNRVRVPASDMKHLFLRKVPNQVRGISMLNPIMQKLYHLSQYSKYEVLQAEAATLNQFYYRQSPESDTYTGQMTPAELAEIYNKAPSKLTKPGQIPWLPPGVDLEAVKANTPHPQFGAFVQAMLREIASGMGINYNFFANDWATFSYSSSKMAHHMSQSNWGVIQDHFKSVVVQPMFEDWLEMQALFNATNVPSVLPFVNLANVDKFKTEVMWHGKKFGTPDALKEAQADAALYELGVTSLRRIAAKYAVDLDEVTAERASELIMIKTAGAPEPHTAILNQAEQIEKLSTEKGEPVTDE